LGAVTGTAAAGLFTLSLINLYPTPIAAQEMINALVTFIIAIRMLKLACLILGEVLKSNVRFFGRGRFMRQKSGLNMQPGHSAPVSC
jgi:hypothetical protein